MKEQKMKTQEQSSTLKEEVPKIKEGLLDKYEQEPKKEVTKETTKLPKPTGWRMLVLPFRMKEKTDGGIIMGTDWVVFARYAGSRIEIEGGEVRLLNDDEILATVQDPTDILHKY